MLKNPQHEFEHLAGPLHISMRHPCDGSTADEHPQSAHVRQGTLSIVTVQLGQHHKQLLVTDEAWAERCLHEHRHAETFPASLELQISLLCSMRCCIDLTGLDANFYRHKYVIAELMSIHTLFLLCRHISDS